MKMEIEMKYCPNCGQKLSDYCVAPSSATEDDIYKDAVRVVKDAGKASASLLQRRLRVGYARAARMIETMEDEGLISPANGKGVRKILEPKARTSA